MKQFCAPLLLALLLLANPAAAEALKIATWNLNWLTLRPEGDPALPNDVHARQPADFAQLRGYATQLDADVVALEEVDGPETAARLFPADKWQLIFTHDHVVQRVGFAVRAGLKVTVNPDLVALDPYPEAHFPLRSGADISLNLPDGDLRLLAVHLKTGCHFDPLSSSTRPACATLRRQMPALRGWIAARSREGASYVVLGDFNREMDKNDEVLAGLEATAPLLRATDGKASPCWGGGAFIDHILAGGAARAWMKPATLKVLVYREEDPAAKERLSDHCPVSVQFNIPN